MPWCSAPIPFRRPVPARAGHDTGNSVLAVVGGTGAYRNVRGEMELKYRNPAGTEFDFVFHLIG